MLGKITGGEKIFNFQKRDFLLLIGFVFGMFLFAEESILTSIENPINTFFPFWFIIVCFVGMIGTIAPYIYLETRENRNRSSIILLFTLLILIIINLVIIFTSKNNIITPITSGENSFLIETNISIQTKFAFAFSFIAIMLAFYLGFVILPKKITGKSFFTLLSILLISACAVFLIYSLIAEWDNYVIFFSKIFGGDHDMYNIDDFAPKSIFPHRNVYGIVIEFALICCMIDYSLNHRNYVFFAIPLLAINLLVTFCKSGILASFIALLIWVIVNLIFSFKNKDKTMKKAFVFYAAVIASFLVAFFIIYAASASFRLKISYIHHFGNTIKSREIIWNSCWQIIQTRFVGTGVGFGVYNAILFNTNKEIIGDPMSVSHSFIFSILGRGGFLLLFLYACLLIYAFYVAVRLWRLNKEFTIASLLSILIFFLHSFMEDNYYMVIVIVIEIIVVNAIYRHEQLKS